MVEDSCLLTSCKMSDQLLAGGSHTSEEDWKCGGCGQLINGTEEKCALCETGRSGENGEGEQESQNLIISNAHLLSDSHQPYVGESGIRVLEEQPNMSKSAIKQPNYSPSTESVAYPSSYGSTAGSQDPTRPTTDFQNHATSPSSLFGPPAGSQNLSKPLTGSQNLSRPPAGPQSLSEPPASSQNLSGLPAGPQNLFGPPTGSQSLSGPPTDSQHLSGLHASSQNVFGLIGSHNPASPPAGSPYPSRSTASRDPARISAGSQDSHVGHRYSVVQHQHSAGPHFGSQNHARHAVLQQPTGPPDSSQHSTGLHAGYQNFTDPPSYSAGCPVISPQPMVSYSHFPQPVSEQGEVTPQRNYNYQQLLPVRPVQAQSGFFPQEQPPPLMQNLSPHDQSAGEIPLPPSQRRLPERHNFGEQSNWAQSQCCPVYGEREQRSLGPDQYIMQGSKALERHQHCVDIIIGQGEVCTLHPLETMDSASQSSQDGELKHREPTT